MLDALKFPNGQFASRKIDVETDGALNVWGNLPLNGVTTTVELKYSRTLANGTMTEVVGVGRTML